MSTATKCDRCGALFESSSLTLNLDVRLGSGETWSEVDFCAACTAPLVALLKTACIGMAKAGRKK